MTELQLLKDFATALASAGSALPWLLLVLVVWAGRKGEFAFGRELRAANERAEQWRLVALSAQEQAKSLLGILERTGGD
jgi:hypothetical protein